MTLPIDIPGTWSRRGLVLRGEDGAWGGFVIGDPCVVRDEEAGAWRMFLFALPPGHGQATCSGDPSDPAAWRFVGPLAFTNPEALGESSAFKPFVVQGAGRPGEAARIDGLYALLVVAGHDAKEVRRAWSRSLAGPWTLEDGPLIPRGSGDAFDARHTDAPSAFLFEDRGEILHFYMGYPLVPQPHPVSPLGSASGCAVERIEDAAARGRAALAGTPAPPAVLHRTGPVLAPSDRAGHWASGWVGGLQILPGRRHRWIGLANASPTAPRADDESLSREEPPPSLGGFAVCDEEFPVQGWRWSDAPLEWTGDVPADALEAGEAVNFWRHFALPLAVGRLAVFYNAGDYFQEKLFLKVSGPAR